MKVWFIRIHHSIDSLINWLSTASNFLPSSQTADVMSQSSGKFSWEIAESYTWNMLLIICFVEDIWLGVRASMWMCVWNENKTHKFHIWCKNIASEQSTFGVNAFVFDSFAFTIFRTEMFTYSRKWGRGIGFFNLQFSVRHFFFIIIILWSWNEQVLISIMPLHESNCYLMSIGENGLKMWTFFFYSWVKNRNLC